MISADLPYCTDIDECLDSRPAFNKAAHCGVHAVLLSDGKEKVMIAIVVTNDIDHDGKNH